jgi:hypothetical protein
MSTLKVSTLQNLSGTEVYTAKAWVNFNGTGTVAIRAAGNVSSITDNGTGDYTLNFTNAFADANYAPVAIGELNGGAMSIANTQAISASSWNVRIRDNAGNNIDSSVTTVAIFR